MKLRRIETWDVTTAQWVANTFAALRKGQVFRSFEPDTDEPVVEKGNDQEITSWVCIKDAFLTDDAAHNGVNYGVNCQGVPGF